MTKQIQNLISDLTLETSVALQTANRMLSNFREEYFYIDANSFNNDKDAKETFLTEYQAMQDYLYAISELLNKSQIYLDFVTGDKTPNVIAFKNYCAEMISYCDLQR